MDRGLVGIATVGAGGLEIALDLTGKDEARLLLEEARRGGILHPSSLLFFRRIRRLQKGPSCLSVPFARIRFRFGKQLNLEAAPSFEPVGASPLLCFTAKESKGAMDKGKGFSFFPILASACSVLNRKKIDICFPC